MSHHQCSFDVKNTTAMINGRALGSIIWEVGLGLCCLMIPCFSKEIQCHVWLLFLHLQITRSDIRPHIKWDASLVSAYRVTFIFLRGLCGHNYYMGLHTVNQQILACYYIWRIACFREYLSRQHTQMTLIVHCIDGETPNLIAAKSFYFEKRQIL